MYSKLVEHNSTPIGSVLEDSDHRGYKPYDWVDTVVDNQGMGVDN